MLRAKSGTWKLYRFFAGIVKGISEQIGGGGALYFHCAKSGHKLDAIRACDRISFCVVDRGKIYNL